jgi:hypothetical protein
MTTYEHSIYYCSFKEEVKLFRFVQSLHIPLGSCNDAENCIFMNEQEEFIAYCKRREAVRLFRFLLSPYSWTGMRNNVQNCTFRLMAGFENLVSNFSCIITIIIIIIIIIIMCRC